MPQHHRSSTAILLLAVCFVLLSSLPGAVGQETRKSKKKKKGLTLPDGVVAHKDIEYARVGDISLKLDLYVPKTTQPPNLVVFFHGGSWRAGSKKGCQVLWLTGHGYAVASVDYRLSTVATFPALIHDSKGAIRFMRANADKYGIQKKNIAVAGSSAGGLIAALLATSGGVKELEGDIGGNLDYSSAVQSALVMYSPTDLYYNATVEQERCDKPNCPLYQLLGGKPSERLAAAKLASATTHVDTGDPPVILLYGSEDKSLVKPLHGERLHAKYQKAGLTSTYQLIQGAGHGGPKYRDAERSKLILDMLSSTLREKTD